MEIINNVKDIYNNIAKDFDNTRYSRWKGVKHFLNFECWVLNVELLLRFNLVIFKSL